MFFEVANLATQKLPMLLALFKDKRDRQERYDFVRAFILNEMKTNLDIIQLLMRHQAVNEPKVLQSLTGQLSTLSLDLLTSAGEPLTRYLNGEPLKRDGVEAAEDDEGATKRYHLDSELKQYEFVVRKIRVLRSIADSGLMQTDSGQSIRFRTRISNIHEVSLSLVKSLG
jgi:hypothetical protein